MELRKRGEELRASLISLQGFVAKKHSQTATKANRSMDFAQPGALMASWPSMLCSLDFDAILWSRTDHELGIKTLYQPNKKVKRFI